MGSSIDIGSPDSINIGFNGVPVPSPAASASVAHGPVAALAPILAPPPSNDLVPPPSPPPRPAIAAPSNDLVPPPSNDLVPPPSPAMAAPVTSPASFSPPLAPLMPVRPSYFPPISAATAPLHNAHRGGGGGGRTAAISAAAVVTLLVLLAAILWFLRRRRKRKRTKISGPRSFSTIDATEFLRPSRAGPRRFSYAELSIATRNFSESELLGRGGFGSVYRGKLEDEDGTLVAVKRIERSSSQGEKEFRAEVNIISDLRHRNLVRLRGWCYEAGTFLLVYDYMSHGSLDHLLFDDTLCAELNWERRHSIAIGLGSALQYLHEECDKVIIHRDIKSSNVLLDETFTAKLGDFGLARQLNQGSSAHTTSVAGTLGYMAPECLIGLRTATRETDMYAFGAVLLELVCGKPALDARRPEEDDVILVEWVWRLHGHNRLMEAVDKRLMGMYDREQARRLLVMGLACSFPDPTARPKIRQTLEALMGRAALQIWLPPSRPPIIIFGSEIARSQLVVVEAKHALEHHLT